MMESTQKRAEPATAPLKSAAGDVRRMKSAGSASVQELKEFLEFLRQHRGKSSQELLGELGKSSLFQAMLKSTVGCLGLMAVLTVVPFFTAGEPQPKTSNAAKKNAAAANTSVAATPTPAAAATAPSQTTGAPQGVDVDKARKAMGLDETKSAPADVNPREKDLDNLLDGVK